jgi:carbon starvation protein
VIGVIAILAIMIILLAVLALVVVKALAESPWGVFTVGATIPIAMFMGGYLRFIRHGRVMEVSVIGVVLLLFAVWGGQFVHSHETLAKIFTLEAEPLAWTVIIYGLAASILPVWLLLAPRDYLSTFMKLGTIFALALGIFLVLPDLKMPAITRFASNGQGLVLAGNLFPFCFITIACGAISGFHTLIASGITPKIITRENYARPIGYGSMLLESLVAIMALIAACTLDPGVYFSMNMKGAPAETVAAVTAAGFPVTVEQMDKMAATIQEHTLFGRTGGAATLAVGMANIFSNVTGGRWLDLWYHFAIMFEALFILTTLDAGTRVGRYLIQDALGHISKPLGDMNNMASNIVASLLVVAGWGYFLIQGVRDPLGGINSLWPLFGIANQLLASIALCLATTVILKMQLKPDNKLGRPIFALVTLIPLCWLLTVTVTAGLQKIYHPSVKIGFLAAADDLLKKQPALQTAVEAAKATGDATAITAAEKALNANQVLRFNNLLDAVVAGAFIVLVGFILFLSIREWILLVARKRIAQLSETAPVWLPDYAIAEARPLGVVSLIALSLALLREVSGEAAVDRAERHAQMRRPAGAPLEVDLLAGRIAPAPVTRGEAYVQAAERKFDGINHCC